MNGYFFYHDHYYLFARVSFFSFLSSETFWVAAGSIVTATALIYTILKNLFDQKQKIENIKHALYFELITNIELLFCGEVERKPLFDINSSVRKDFIRFIKNQKLFTNIQKLYSELDYYQTFVQNVYLKIKNSGVFVTEKQLSTMNKFLEFFGIQSIVRSATETWDQARDRAIVEKNNHIKEWTEELNGQVEQLFK